MIKTFATRSPEKLANLQFNEEFACDLDDCKEVLSKENRHHFQALLAFHKGLFDEAFTSWASILKGSVSDPFFPGMDFFIQKLKWCPVENQIWRYADFVLDHDESQGVQLFNSGENNRFLGTEKEEKVAAFLSKYPKAHISYLEHLVIEQDSQVWLPLKYFMN